MSLVDRLRGGDALHQEAVEALQALGEFSEYVLSDDKRAIAFVQWQRAKRSHLAPTPEEPK